MRKVLLFAAILCSFAFVNAQVVDAGFDADDVEFWAGDMMGENEVVISVVWADTALAWGYQFSEDSVSVMDVLEAIAAYDWRITLNAAGGMVNDIVYNDLLTTHQLSTATPAPGSYIYFQLQVNHEVSMLGADEKMVVDGDFIKWGDTYVATIADSTWISDWGGYWDYTYVWPQTIYPAVDEGPEDASIDKNEILYWVGTGDKELVMAINWADPDTCLAWGVRFSDEYITNDAALALIANEDPRFSYSGAAMLDELTFITENGDSLRLTQGSFWSHNLNGNQSAGINAQLHDGDFSKWGDIAVGIGYMYMDWGGVLYPMGMSWVTPVTPVSVPGAPVVPEDATIDEDQIIYWVGTGDNEAIFIVNWCDPDTALAWGYRFSADSVLVSTMLSDIAAADPRFSFEGEDFLSSIQFVMGQESFVIEFPDFIMYNINGGYANAVDVQYFDDNDYIKFGGYSCADLDINYNATWDTPIAPVPAPTAVINHDNTILSIAPNPCTNNVSIQTAVNEVVSIYNLQGALMMRTIATEEVTNLDVNELPAGFYFVQSGNRTAKLVKK